MAEGYLDKISEIEKFVDGELQSFRVLTTHRKISNLAMNLKVHCESKISANRYSKLEKDSKKYKELKEDMEYRERLTESRLLKKIPLLLDEELLLYVEHLQAKLNEGLSSKDTKKRFFVYDYVTAGCRLCRVNNIAVQEKLKEVRDNASQLISAIPTL